MSVIGWPVNPSAPPGAGDVVGEMATNNDGRRIGYELVSTSIAGSWQGNSRSLYINPPATPGDKWSGRTVIEAGHGQMWFFMHPNGVYDAYADGCRDGGRIIRGVKFQGRIFKMTDTAYCLVNGAHQPDKSGWSSTYYPVLMDRERKHATIFTMDTSAAFPDCEQCRDYGRLFVEQQWFTKVSDEIDLEVMRGVREFSDQWLWKDLPEDGAQGEQYPDTCTPPSGSYTPVC